MSHDLKDKYALVTGGADGIGAMLSQGLADLGMKVLVLDIREEPAKALAKKIGGEALVADVSERAEQLAIAENVKTRGIKLDILWINAGVGAGASLIKGSERTVRWAYEVNVLGAIWSAQAFTPLVADKGQIGVTASSAALRTPEAPLTLYAATKHATLGFAEGLRAELEPENIPVHILCPGILNTKIWDAARARPDKYGGIRHMDPSISGRWDEANPPEIMWPYIEEALAAREGGYLAIADSEVMEANKSRQHEMAAGFHPFYVD